MSTSPKLLINLLVLVGHDKNYSVKFNNGINIIYGDSDTGKSSILNLIDYLLGASKVEMYDEIEKKVKYALLELSIENKIYTIKRDIFKPNDYIQVFKSTIDGMNKVFPIEYAPNYRKEGGSGFFSDFLLTALNIPLLKVKQAPSRADSPMKRVSFRDIFKYNFLNQDDVGSKYILDTRNYAVKVKNQETFKFIHNLLDDQITQLEEEISNKITEKKKSDSDYKTVSSFFSDAKLEQEHELEEIIIRLDKELKANEQEIQIINTKMKSNNTEFDELRALIIKLENEFAELNKEKYLKKTQLDRNISLRKNYTLDIEKLQSAIEVSNKMPQETDLGVRCPICDNHLIIDETDEHQTNVDTINVEIRSLKSRIKELNTVIDDVRNSIYMLERKEEYLTEDLIKARDLLDMSVSDYISPYISHRDVLISQKTEILEQKQQQLYLLKLRKKLDDFVINSQTISDSIKELQGELKQLRELIPTPRKVLEPIENILLEFLKFIPIKNLSNVGINEKTFLPIVRDRDYTNLTSGGLRTIVSVGYFISLLFNSLNTKTNLPSLLMIDTIGKYLGKTKDKYMDETNPTDDKNEQVNDPNKYLNMYKFIISNSEHLLKANKDHQIIIVDNDIPTDIEAALIGYIVKRFKPGFEVGLIDDIKLQHAEFTLTSTQKEDVLAEYKDIESRDFKKSELERMETEAGIKVLDSSSIFEILEEHVRTLLDDIEDSINYRNDLELQIFNFTEEGEQELINAFSKITKNKLSINVFLSLDENSGAESIVTLGLFINDELVDTCDMIYTNGEAEYDIEQGYYLPSVYNEFNEGNLDEFIELINVKMQEFLPNLVEAVDDAKASYVLDGLKYPVAESDCTECGEPYICIDPEICEIGLCVNCGEQNNISECDRCGKLYNPDTEGDTDLCEECNVYRRDYF
jgi:hypothetical protein